MSYLSRLYNHRNGQSPEGKDKSFFSRKEQGGEKTNKKNFFQAKLSVNEPGDKYEHEADRAAAAVANNKTAKPVVQQKEISSVQRLATSLEDEQLATNDRRMERDKEDKLKPVQRSAATEKEKDHAVQKMDAPEKEEKKPKLQKMELPEKKMEIEKPVQKMSADHEKEKVQKKDSHLKDEEKHGLQKKDDHLKEKEKEPAIQAKQDAPGNTASPQVASQIKNKAGKGKKLPAKTMKEMNASFGTDFSGVRIHNDSDAANMSRELQAQAFTHGSDIYFNDGKFDPDRIQGKFLLAHELTHVIQQGAAQSPESVQRAKIDYRPLTWPDFAGKVPKNAAFDAETSSHFTDFDSSKYPFKSLAAVESGTTAHRAKKNIDCKTGMDADKHADQHPGKYKAYTVNIEADPTLIAVKAYMWQEKSWAKPWTTDAKARKAKAQGAVAKCTEAFSKKNSEIKADCNTMKQQCENVFKTGKQDEFKSENATALDKHQCETAIKPACVDAKKADFSYHYKNQNEVKADAARIGDCTTSFQQQMIDTVLKDSSDSLLNHEQRHFDLTNRLAEQLTGALRAKASSFSIKQVEACSEQAALKAAEDVLALQRKELDAVVKTFNESLAKLQTTYDNETKHGTAVEGQHRWDADIDDSLKKKSGNGSSK